MPELDYLDLLRNGLPESRQPRKHIVVAGAGIAGLTAAMLLKQVGHKVTILEAQNRLGGRIFTCREFSGSMYGEFGAMRFPKQHSLGQYLIHEKFKLPVQPFPLHNDNTYIHLNGRLIRRSAFNARDFGFDLPGLESASAPDQLLNQAIKPLIETISMADKNAAWQKLLQEYDHYSLIAYLRFRGISEKAIAVMGPMLNLEPRLHYSLLEWFLHYYEDVFGDLEYIETGADSLPNSYLPLLGSDIRFGAKVHEIKQEEDHVIVNFNSLPRLSHRIVADECIVTIPFNLLRHIEIDRLDAQKSYAMRNTYYGRAHKILMQFSERWWQDKYGMADGATVTDLALRNVVYTPAGQDYSTRKGVIIASYCWEQDSMTYSSLSEEKRISEALQDLSKIHPEASETFEFGVTHDWAQDEYAGGIGPLFRPYEMGGRIYEDLIRPVHRVWFANDACDRKHRRWIEGSLKAAIKNAHSIHCGLRNEMPWRD